MSVSQEFGRFNIYDLFSTFLPGATLLIGVTIPHPAAPEYLTNITFASLFVWLIIAFVTGLFLQSIAGSFISGEDSFADRMSSVVESGKDDDKVTAAEVQFLEAARDEFGFDANFEDWDHMYRAVLTELEQNPPSRAIRLQALFLAMRGIAVGLGLVAISLAIYFILEFRYTVSLHSPLLLYGVGTGFLFIMAGITKRRAEEFSEDVVSYMITEFRTMNA